MCLCVPFYESFSSKLLLGSEQINLLKLGNISLLFSEGILLEYFPSITYPEEVEEKNLRLPPFPLKSPRLLSTEWLIICSNPEILLYSVTEALTGHTVLGSVNLCRKAKQELCTHHSSWLFWDAPARWV